MTAHSVAVTGGQPPSSDEPDDIPAARGELLAHLGAAIAELNDATTALVRLQSHAQCAAELLDGRDVGTFIEDARRFSLAAYALLYTVIDSKGPFR